MKKIVILSVIFMLILTPACSSKKEIRSDDFLYDKGIEMISSMKEAALTESYIEGVLPNEDNPFFSKVSEVVLEKPSKVYEIKLSKELLENQFSKNITADISKAFERSLVIKSKESLALQVNSKSGADAIVFSSLTAFKDAFSYPDLKEDVTYLYRYDEELSVMVTYSVYEDAVSALSYFMVHETMEDVKSVENLKVWFEENLNLKDIKIRWIH
jgi:hypothetical protein